MQSVMTHLAPAAIGPYSQGILMKDMMFVSGQLGVDPNTGEFVEGFEAQTAMVFANIKSILSAVGMGFPNVVKCSVFLKNMDDFAVMNEIYARYFSAPFPAREAFQVGKLPKDGMIEISVIAMR